MDPDIIPADPDDIRDAMDAFGVTMVDKVEHAISELPPAECPLDHIFTPGLYVRCILMRAGTLISSKIHKTEHPYVVLRGKVSVWTREAGVVRFGAPYIGVTKPGTKRILYIHEDTIWATFHPTDLTDLAEIEAAIIEPHVNPLLKIQKQPCLNY